MNKQIDFYLFFPESPQNLGFFISHRVDGTIFSHLVISDKDHQHSQPFESK
jgi:hypothetical protein